MTSAYTRYRHRGARSAYRRERATSEGVGDVPGNARPHAADQSANETGGGSATRGRAIPGMGALRRFRRRLPANWVFRLLLLVSVLGLGTATIVTISLPAFYLSILEPQLDLILNATTMMATGAVAVLAWIRFREVGQPDSLLQSSGFLVWFAVAIVGGAVLLFHMSFETGFTREAPGQAPLYIWTFGRIIGGVLLLLGAIAGLRDWHPPPRNRALAVTFVPATVVLVASLVFIAARDRLPELIPQAALALLPTSEPRLDPGLANSPLFALQMIVAALFFAGAAGYARLYERRDRRRPYSRWLAIGLIIAAFSEIRFAIFPGIYEGLLTTADVLRLAFDFLVLVGVAAGVRHDLAALRDANVTLVELRTSDAHRIALEERARLAREVHDGLVQDLWLARLTQGRLTQMPNISGEVREIVNRVDRVLEDALAEARQAVVALQPQSDDSFGSLLGRIVEDYGDRFGLEIIFETASENVRLPGHIQAEVLRICREALNNARKHADASVVRVALEADDEVVRLTIKDNGSGFEMNGGRKGGFGMRSMHERAEVIGGRLDIRSAPMEGTRVTLELERGALATRLATDQLLTAAQLADAADQRRTTADQRRTTAEQRNAAAELVREE